MKNTRDKLDIIDASYSTCEQNNLIDDTISTLSYIDLNQNISDNKDNRRQVDIQYKNGDKYKGFINRIGQRDGIGTYMDTQGNKYVGDFISNQAEGNGSLYFSNGDIYKGEWKKGKMNGKGSLYYKSGEEYHGDFMNGVASGYGTFYNDEGEWYQGEFKNNLKNGKGEYHYLNGDKTVGLWKNGKEIGEHICLRGTVELYKKKY